MADPIIRREGVTRPFGKRVTPRRHHARRAAWTVLRLSWSKRRRQDNADSVHTQPRTTAAAPRSHPPTPSSACLRRGGLLPTPPRSGSLPPRNHMQKKGGVTMSGSTTTSHPAPLREKKCGRRGCDSGGVETTVPNGDAALDPMVTGTASIQPAPHPARYMMLVTSSPTARHTWPDPHFFDALAGSRVVPRKVAP